MTRWKYAAVMTLAIGAVSAYQLMRRPVLTPSSASALPARLGCNLAVGDSLGYKLHTSSSASGGAAGHGGLVLDAVMWWKVIESRGGGWVVAGSLQDVRMSGGASDSDPAAAAPLTDPFVFTIGKDCRFHDVSFLPGTEAQTRRQLEGLLRSTEFVFSSRPQWNWVHRQSDLLGSYDASYTLSKGDVSPLQVGKQRNRYVSMRMPEMGSRLGGTPSAEVLSSQATAIMDEHGKWLRALSEQAELKISIGDRTLSQVTTMLSVARTEEGNPPVSLAAVDASKFRKDFAEAPLSTSALPTPPDPALAGQTLDGVLIDFKNGIGQSKDGAFRSAQRLASYLSVHPEAIAVLLEQIRSGAIDPKLHSLLFLALERTGTLAAEKALGSAMADRGMKTENRMRAAAALQDIPRPSVGTAKTLVDQARQQGSAEDVQVSRSALLALGALSHRTLERQPEVSELARGEFRNHLQTAQNPEEIRTVLAAIGNAGDKSLVDTLSKYSQDAEEQVRASAADAYRRMDRTTMEPQLRDWLGKEEAGRVRAAIAGSLVERLHEDRQPASAETIAIAAARLATESDPRARSALIELLGTAAATDAAAKQALIQQFSRETAVDLKVLIGRFVSGEDLK